MAPIASTKDPHPLALLELCICAKKLYRGRRGERRKALVKLATADRGVDDGCAGDVTGGVTAHAIRNRPETDIRAVQDRIFR